MPLGTYFKGDMCSEKQLAGNKGTQPGTLNSNWSESEPVEPVNGTELVEPEPVHKQTGTFIKDQGS